MLKKNAMRSLATYVHDLDKKNLTQENTSVKVSRDRIYLSTSVQAKILPETFEEQLHADA